MAIVKDANLARDVATVTIEISREDYLGYPIAPADLRVPDTNNDVFHFHQLVKREGCVLVFETYQSEFPLPQKGTSFAFCSWWVPKAMEAVRDTAAKWKRQVYPDNGKHNHCLLTYKSISAYDENMEGYQSTYGWLTVTAYQEYIANDRLRVRSNWKSIERFA